MGKVVIFDWGGVIMHKHPVDNNDRQAIIRTIRSFKPNLTDEEAWDVYAKTLIDENGIYISRQDDELSKIKWVDRINRAGNFTASVDEFSARFIAEHFKVGYYKELVDFIYSLKDVCQIGLFSDLIFCCAPVLDKQVDLSQFDYVWLSYITHLRKNTEEVFELVEKDVQVSPEDILLIDDTTVNIENAKKRGWNTCQAFGYELDKIKDSVEKFTGYKLKSESNGRKML